MDIEAGVPASSPTVRHQRGSATLHWRISLPFSERRALLLVGDTLIVIGAVLAALRLWAWVDGLAFDPAFAQSRWFWFPLLVGAWWTLAWLGDLYDVPLAVRRMEVAGQVLSMSLGLVTGYLVVYFLLPREALPRLFFLFFSEIILGGMLVWRWTYATVFTLPILRDRLLIIGAGWAGRTLAEMLIGQKATSYHVLGFIDDDPSKQGLTVANLPVLGTSADLVNIAHRYGVDRIAVAITHTMRGDLLQALMECRAMGKRVIRMPELYEELTRRVPVEHVDEGWVLDAMRMDQMHLQLYQTLVTDPEKSVRETAKRTWKERRDRLWAEKYLSIVTNVKGETNKEILDAWRYGEALVRTGDDSCIQALREHLAQGSHLPNVRYWIRQIVEDLEENWRKKTQKWPDPWFAWEGTIEVGQGKAQISNGETTEVNYSVWYQPAPTPSELGDWGGAMWCTPMSLESGHGMIELQDGRRGKIAVTKTPGDTAIFWGDGPYPT